MSVTNKSLDKNKRFAGFKANDFVNQTRATEANRSTARPQGWANLGKINSRRIPPPANLPSLKSETGVNPTTFDPTVTTNHGWAPNENQTTNNSQLNPTQQQIDSLPVNSPTPPPSSDVEKSRLPPTWSTITTGTNMNSHEQIPNLLALNDFPHLSTTQERKSQPETISNFRPTNLSTWKDGGGNRLQTLTNDSTQIITNNYPGANFYPQQQQQMSNPNMRMFSTPMWNYNPYTSIHQTQHLNTINDYKSPTILRNKDIDDLSNLTDNTWANASQEVNYEEKIRFSDDDDNDDDRQHRRIETFDSNDKTRRINSRLIQDDEHLKQMRDDKNFELINALNIAKQRRDEQERHLRNERLTTNIDERKQVPGYQTRPLLTSNDQDNHNTSNLWQINKDSPRSRHDTSNSQSSFAMKSWSDQMDSFNYSSTNEKSARNLENDESILSKKFSRSHSESSVNSQTKNNNVKSKKPLLTSKKNFQTKSTSKKTNKIEKKNLHEKQIKSNDQWNETNNNKRQQQNLQSDEHKTQKSNRYNKNQMVWRPLSPTRQSESVDPTPQESISYKTQQRTNLNERKQRYSTMIDTASIPPLMSVRSDVTTTGSLYQTTNHSNTSHYDDETGYYQTNLTTHQRYAHSNLHHRRYTTLGSYGRYRRNGTTRHQQQYTNYNNINNTSGVSSAPTTSSGTRQKKNSNNKKINQDETFNIQQTNDDLEKTIQTTLVTSINQQLTIENNKKQDENQITKINKTNSKQRTNKDKVNYQQEQHYQQAPRHRNNYSRSMQNYETMHNYYDTTRRTGHNNTRNAAMHDLSCNYYYEPSHRHYNNRYDYSNENYEQKCSTNKNRQRILNRTNNNNNNNNFRLHSISDNDQKEGEEWETASESSTNMRNGHTDNSGINNQQTNETKLINRGRTPPEKSFSNQRPNARQIFKYTNA